MFVPPMQPTQEDIDLARQEAGFDLLLQPRERMRLRDQFAAAALAGVVAMQKASFYPSEVACYAYEIADAMLSAREVK